MLNILVLCTGNSCRSQMAHGYLQYYFGREARVYSAGIEARGVNPNAVKVMLEDGIDISSHTSNLASEYSNIPFDFVITVCDNAKENCPVFPYKAEKRHYDIPDPADFTGSEDEILEQFRVVRNNIRGCCMQIANAHKWKYMLMEVQQARSVTADSKVMELLGGMDKEAIINLISVFASEIKEIGECYYDCVHLDGDGTSLAEVKSISHGEGMIKCYDILISNIKSAIK